MILGKERSTTRAAQHQDETVLGVWEFGALQRNAVLAQL